MPSLGPYLFCCSVRLLHHPREGAPLRASTMDPPQPAARPAYYSTAYQQGQPGEYYTYPAGTSSSDLAPASPSPRASLDDIYSGRSGPRPRRTSVASSFAESVASSHVSSTHSSLPRSSGSARPPSMSEVSLSPRLHPGGSDGFLVDVPGAGIFEVPWSELVGLLVTCESRRSASGVLRSCCSSALRTSANQRPHSWRS